MASTGPKNAGRARKAGAPRGRAGTPGRAMLKGPVVGVRKQTAGPRTSAQRQSQKPKPYKAPLPPQRSSGGGFDPIKGVNDFLDSVVPGRTRSNIVPDTMRKLPAGGVQGVIGRK